MPAERERLAGFGSLKRQQDWLLGRLAAKLAVDPAHPERVAIAVGPRGHPHAEAAPYLSISHSHGEAVAVTAPVPVGIDLERKRELPERGHRFFLHADERHHEPILAWTLKEAAYKALHGELDGLLGLRLEALEPGRALLSSEGRKVQARYVESPGFFLAIATTGPWFDVTLPGLP